MRPTVLAWLARHGWPAWVLPNYFMLAAVSAVLASAIALRIAAHDRATGVADRASDLHTARALACAYVAALLGGYVFEAMRALPAAVAAGSWGPVLHAGRAAYGGLLGAIVAAALYLLAVGEPLTPFFDRIAIGVGITFGLVRTGCFLAGCDYGLPTVGVLGVRFPPGSLAALDHVRRGFVPRGYPSLPVHPTQLYEAGLGLIAAAVAAVSLARSRGRRDGRVFGLFMGIYASGRFIIEILRGDQERGQVRGLSTGQWVSVAILTLILGVAATRWLLRRRLQKTRIGVGFGGAF